MDKYKVLYRSTGLLSGKEPGDTVELDSVDGKHLEGLGIVKKMATPKSGTEGEKPKAAAPTKPAAKPAAKAKPKGGES